MRLTLRTLLAYMDEILEPADREELAKKVESSEFAHDLIHRTKDTMRRLRLSAPQVVGTGIGLDPNTVAEYLDNVLPPDSVADIERICLESDVHLAEVASCHHVLTMVLGEPAEVDPAARQRMYAIPAEAENRKHLRVEAAHAAIGADRKAGAPPLPAANLVSPASISPTASIRSDSVPDYLRTSAWTSHHLLLAACAAVLLAAVTILIKSSLSGWSGEGPQAAVNSTDETTDGVPPLATSPADTPLIASPPTNDGKPAADYQATSQPMAGAPPRLMTPQMNGTAAPPSAESTLASAAAANSVDPVEQTTVENLAADSQTSTLNVATPPPVASPPVDTDSTEIASDPPGAESVPDSGTETAATPATDLVQRPVELGTYLDGENILLRIDPSTGEWFRMSRSPLQAGDKLLAMPAFYPNLTLASGLQLKLAGGSLVTLGVAQQGADIPSIDVAYGKVRIVNTDNGENSVALTLGGVTAVASLQPSATLAVSVEPKFVPGHDPRQAASPVNTDIFVLHADVAWDDASGKKLVPASSHWSIADGAASEATSEATFPDWIDQEPVEPLSEKLYGAPGVDKSLDTTRPVADQLLELYQESRKREVKSLAARSSVYVGSFMLFIEALRDSDQRPTWDTQIETLRSAMALSPESADKVWEVLVDQRGEPTARDLYEMLCGYSPEQIGTTPEEIQAGPVVRLIDWMENDNLDYRVLAVHDMYEITGQRLMPNPAGGPIERARGVRKWRQRLKDGEIPLATQ